MRFSLAALAIVLSVGSLAAAKPVVDLVGNLGSPDFREREAASRELEALGEASLAALRKAAKSHADPEVVRRAAEIAIRIGKKIDDEKTLAPTLVELAFDDKPLGEVLDELEKQTGYKISVTDPTVRHKNVSVTTTGKIAYWSAVERICDAAGLEIAVGGDIVDYRNQPRRSFDPVQPAERLPKSNYTGPVVLNGILLRPSTGTPRLAFVRGAVRIAVVSMPNAMSATYPKDTLPILLVAMPEPKLKWERVVSIGIANAMDDRGQELIALSSNTSNAAAPRVTSLRVGGNVVVGPNGVIMVPGRGMADPSTASGFNLQPTQGVARLKVGLEPTKALATFRGTVRGAVRTAPEVLAAVGNHDAATNAPPSGGPRGVSLKASAFVASTADPEMFEADVLVSYSASEVQLADANGSPLPQETIMMQGAGRVIVRRSVSSSSVDRGRTATQIAGLSVLDSEGRPFPINATGYRRQMDGSGGINDTLKLIIKSSAKTEGKPTAVTFTATRAKSVDVPFELTGVPVVAGLGPTELKPR